MNFEERIRATRHRSGHRHLPLSPRAERELEVLLGETAAGDEPGASAEQRSPHASRPQTPITSAPLHNERPEEPPAPARHVLVALVACVALAVAVGLPLGIHLWPGSEDAVPPAVPGPTAPEPAPTGTGSDEEGTEPNGEEPESDEEAIDDPVDPDERLTDLPDGGAERVADTELPGQDRAMFFAQENRVADVVMVEHDDVLHVRAEPGPESEVVGALDADGHVTLAGRQRILGLEDGEAWAQDTSSWAEIRLNEGYGWVHTHYLGYLGYVEQDPAVAEDVPPAMDPAQIAASVGTRVASSWERPESGASAPGLGEPGWSVVHAEQDGRRAIYWVDVTGIADDSGRGSRYQLTLFDTGHGWEIDEAVAITICRRGASKDSGHCI